MIGAIIGDIVGSRFEWHNIKTKDFELFHGRCHPTDDSVMTLAIAKAVLEYKQGKGDLSELAIKYMQELGNRYPHAGYGKSFKGWLFADNPQPYNSCGNGSAMRVSPCGFAAETMEEVIAMSEAVTKVTHNHPEGMKGAKAVALAVYLAMQHCIMPEIKEILNGYYKVDFTLDDIRADYKFDSSCQGTLPVALAAFYESKNFEDAIRNAISIGGDSDTIAAITGAIAEAYYGVPDNLRTSAVKFLYPDELEILNSFENIYIPKKQPDESVHRVIIDDIREKEDREIIEHFLAIKNIIRSKCSRCDSSGCLGCIYSSGEMTVEIDKLAQKILRDGHCSREYVAKQLKAFED